MKKIILLGVVLTFLAEAETFDVSITSFKFTPNDLEIEVGDTVRWTNNQGFHDVLADDNDFSSGPASSSPFVFEKTFNSVAEILYHCSIHSGAGRDINTSMNGRINVVMPQVVEPTFEINQGISGAWFFPNTSGSGFLIDIRPADKFFFTAWFTHDVTDQDRPEEDTGTRWFTASGFYDGHTATLDLFETSGGLFDSPQAVTTSPVGTVTFDFSDCGSGEVSYEFTNDSTLAGSFPIQRAIPSNEALCESLVVNDSAET